MRPVASSSLRGRLESLRHGQHLCLFYEEPAEQLTIAAAYLQLGLARGERCVYTADPSLLGVMKRTLAAFGTDVDQEIDRGALVLLSKNDTHLHGGRFHTENMLGLLALTLDQTLEAGFKGLRAAGDMSWLMDNPPGSDEVFEYEARLNDFFPNTPAMCMCLFDRRRLHPLVLEGALRSHPTAFIGETCCETNPFYESPEVFFQRVDPRERFAWKLQQLRDRVGSQGA